MIEQLKRLGLTEGEAKCYEALLKLGSSTVGPIVKRSGIAYSNIYEVISRLQDKGLVTFITREKTKVFSAAPPHRLSEYLDKKETELSQTKQLLKQMLPGIARMQSYEFPDAEIFTGSKGLRTAYDILYEEIYARHAMHKDAEALYFFMHDESYTKYAYEFYAKEWPRMKKDRFKARGIGNIGYKKTSLSKKAPAFLHERYVSFPVPGNIDIVNDKIMITSWSETPVAILIRSRQVADNFKNYFETVWKIAKK